MKIKLLFLTSVMLLFLSGCITTILAGSSLNSVSWLFDGVDNETSEADKNKRIKENYIAFCKSADDAFDEYADEILNICTADVVSDNLYLIDDYFGESEKLDFFTSLTVYKNIITARTENKNKDSVTIEITNEDIKEFILLFFDFRINKYTTTSVQKKKIKNAAGKLVEIEEEVVTSHADVNFFTRYDFYNYLSFTEDEKKRADYIESILSGITEDNNGGYY